jgi:hypothetical protein
LTSQLPNREEKVTTKPDQLAAVIEPVPNPFNELNEALRAKDEALRDRDEKIADLRIELEVLKRVQAILDAQRTAPATAAIPPAVTPPPPVFDSPPTSAQVAIEVAAAGRLDEPTPPPPGTSEQHPREPMPQQPALIVPTNLRLVAQ